MNHCIPVVPASPESSIPAQTLVQRWGLSLGSADEAPYYLSVGERVELRQSGDEAPGPVFVDFVGGALGHRRRFGGGRGQPLAKAVGLKHGKNPEVLDATAGLGRDAFVLASLGCRVTLVERSAVACAMLDDGLRRAAEDAEAGHIVRERMQLVHAEAVAFLEALPEARRPDVVYLDPMFPPRHKSALVKKEMRVFHGVVGSDPDSDRLLPAALKAAGSRVVVKRPDYAGWLAEMKPTMSISSKKHRFDVYVMNAVCAGA